MWWALYILFMLSIFVIFCRPSEGPFVRWLRRRRTRAKIFWRILEETDRPWFADARESLDFIDWRLFLYRPGDATRAPWVTLSDRAIQLDCPLTDDLAGAEDEESVWTMLDLVQRGKQRRDQRAFEREIRPIDLLQAIPRAWRDDAAVLRVSAETGQHGLDRLVLRCLDRSGRSLGDIPLWERARARQKASVRSTGRNRRRAL